MHKIIVRNLVKPISFLSIIFSVFAFQTDTPCDATALREKAKKQLEHYKYDMSKITRVAYKKVAWFKEIEVPLFIGEKYRLVFNLEALPKPIIISIYNRDRESKKRKLLFTTKDSPVDQKQFSFEISKANKAFVDYEIPADSTLKTGGGCAIFMLGYK